MKLDNQNNKPGKLTESDIDRIAKKVLQSEQMFPEVGQAKDFFAGLKGIYTGRGYLPSKYHSAIERVGKTFLKDWDRQENLISYLYNLPFILIFFCYHYSYSMDGSNRPY